MSSVLTSRAILPSTSDPATIKNQNPGTSWCRDFNIRTEKTPAPGVRCGSLIYHMTKPKMMYITKLMTAMAAQ